MIRNLVGALILVGEGKINREDLNNILDLKREGNYMTVPANGLYLVDVKYQRLLWKRIKKKKENKLKLI